MAKTYKTYGEKLKDPRWQKKRLEILERDGWACTKCGDKEATLHIHHVIYQGEPWDCPDECLHTVCECCHAVLEDLDKEEIAVKSRKVISGDLALVQMIVIGNGSTYVRLYDYDLIKKKAMHVTGLSMECIRFCSQIL